MDNRPGRRAGSSRKGEESEIDCLVHLLNIYLLAVKIGKFQSFYFPFLIFRSTSFVGEEKYFSFMSLNNAVVLSRFNKAMTKIRIIRGPSMTLVRLSVPRKPFCLSSCKTKFWITCPFVATRSCRARLTLITSSRALGR